MKKKVLFIDIDGVLFGEYEGCYQLRPKVASFFYFASQHFQCEFLTCWSWQRIQTLLELLYIDRRSLRLGYRVWYNLKTDGIKPKQEDFYIIDDNLIAEEVAQLKEWNLAERYLKVKNKGINELEVIKKQLIRVAGLTDGTN